MTGEGMEGDFYRVLGVDYRASQDEIENVYHELARRLHPDITGDDPELTMRYMAVNEAYRILSKPEERAEYDRSIGIDPETGEGEAKPKPGQVRRADTPAHDMRLLDAKLRRDIREASRLCGKGNFWEATRLLEKYLKTHPDSPKLRKALASAALGRKRYHEAVNHMKVVCKVEYHEPDNFVELAAIYLEAGQIVLAEKALGEALGWNAKHEGALNMRRRIEERKDAEKPPVQRALSRLTKALRRRGG